MTVWLVYLALPGQSHWVMRVYANRESAERNVSEIKAWAGANPALADDAKVWAEERWLDR